MALSTRPVDRSAIRKPVLMESRATNTATTRAIPKTASRVTFQRTTRLRML
jgi:hypothetical protein